MVCLGFEPGGWKVQKNPLSYGSTPEICQSLLFLKVFKMDHSRPLVLYFSLFDTVDENKKFQQMDSNHGFGFLVLKVINLPSVPMDIFYLLLNHFHLLNAPKMINLVMNSRALNCRLLGSVTLSFVW